MTRQTAFPYRVIQWLRDLLNLTYRCGGSAGIACNDTKRTGFPFHPHEKTRGNLKQMGKN